MPTNSLETITVMSKEEDELEAKRFSELAKDICAPVREIVSWADPNGFEKWRTTVGETLRNKFGKSMEKEK